MKPAYFRRQPVATRALGILVTACAATACASSGSFAGDSVAPLIAQQRVTATAPKRPLQVVFDWSLRERESRFTGSGAARVQPPYLGRLDLFGPRGETYLSAAIDGERMQLPAGAPADVLPPPAMLWSALGVLYPPADAELIGTSTNGTGEPRLEYARGRERWRFRVQDDMLRYAEWLNGADGRRTVELEGTAGPGVPARAVYRDWLAFRELELSVKTIEEVEAFSSDVFSIPR